MKKIFLSMLLVGFIATGLSARGVFVNRCPGLIKLFLNTINAGDVTTTIKSGEIYVYSSLKDIRSFGVAVYKDAKITQSSFVIAKSFDEKLNIKASKEKITVVTFFPQHEGHDVGCAVTGHKKMADGFYPSEFTAAAE
ncbi:MAG: hypothetical protein ABIF12_02900 [bacterium]